MNNSINLKAGYWTNGELPTHVEIGPDSIVTGDQSFTRFRTHRTPGLTIGSHCTMEGVDFALGEEARVEIGDYCYFTTAILLCELELRFGNYVMLGWNATIADSDFHPIAPAERIADAIACSPLGEDRARPEIIRQRVTIEDDVWIGPNATILKGVCIGAGAFIEAGALVTRDVPSRARVLGNPGRVIGKV